MSLREQRALVVGAARLDGCHLVWRFKPTCSWHGRAPICFQVYSRFVTKSLCEECIEIGLTSSQVNRYPIYSVLPRIVAIDSALWIALEVAWHQIATYADRLATARAAEAGVRANEFGGDVMVACAQ